MSKKLKGVDIDSKISSMDASTSEIKGVLSFKNKTKRSKKLDKCILDVFVVGRDMHPLLLHSYILTLNLELEEGCVKDFPFSLDGLILSSIASEIVDLKLILRGSNTNTYLNVTRGEYIDKIESILKDLGFELDDYDVEIRAKISSKLFRQYYIYINTLEDYKIKVTYTPNKEYFKMCIYTLEDKVKIDFKYKEINDAERIKSKLIEIFTE